MHHFLAKMPAAVLVHNTESGHRFWCSHASFPLAHVATPLSPTDSRLDQRATLQVMWNDVAHQAEPSSAFTDPAEPATSPRGGPIQQVGAQTIHAFCETNQICWMFRGHQDIYYNAFLRVGDRFVSVADAQHPLVNTQPGREHVGCVAVLAADRARYLQDPVLPVLTLATCTEIGKPLRKDSWAVLVFE